MSSVPTVYAPDFTRDDERGFGRYGGVIAIASLGAIVIILIVALIVVLVFNGNSGNINTLAIAQGSAGMVAENRPVQQIQEQPILRKEDYDIGAMLDQEVGISGFGETQEMANVDEQHPTNGLMNNPQAREKKWDPKTMIPDPQKSVRPADSLAAKFGPSEEEVAAYLPTNQDLLREQPHGPRFIRTPSPAVNVKFAELPKSVQDHNDQLKGNRARINKAAYVRAREMHRRQTEQMQATDMDFV